MKQTRLEKVLEHMVNGEIDLAKELSHKHIVSEARRIYADLVEADNIVEDDILGDEYGDEMLLDDPDYIPEIDPEDDYFDLLPRDRYLEEDFDDSDRTGDFERDIETIEDEIDAEEYFSEGHDFIFEDEDEEDDEEDEEDEDEDEDEDEEDEEVDDALADLENEMKSVDMDEEDFNDADFNDVPVDMDDVDGETIDDPELEAAMVNAEDSLDELRAAFADAIGDDGDEEEPADEFADEMGEDETADDEGDEGDDERELEESATLKKYGRMPAVNDRDGRNSPVRSRLSDMSNGHARPVRFAGGNETGRKAPSSEMFKVPGPQEQRGRMDKKVSRPKNTSPKSRSVFGK